MRTEFLLNGEEVTIDENAEVTVCVPEEYEEVAVTTEGMIIGYDEAVCSWVSLGYND